jgi:hypothetical protein
MVEDPANNPLKGDVVNYNRNWVKKIDTTPKNDGQALWLFLSLHTISYFCPNHASHSFPLRFLIHMQMTLRFSVRLSDGLSSTTSRCKRRLRSN